MQFISRYATICALILAGFCWTDSAGAARFRQDVVIVKLKPQAAATSGRTRGSIVTGIPSLDALNVRLDARRFSRTVPNSGRAGLSDDPYGLSRYYTVELAPGSDLEAALTEYAADPNVELAEPDYIMPLTAVPNDPSYVNQWHHKRPNDVDIDTEEAWDLEVGDSTVLVGIIDSGVLWDHEDLRASIWVNPGEDLDGDGVVYDADDFDGIDNDGNGYIDDVIGYDFFGPQSGCWAGEDCDGPDNDPRDFAGHGTHVGGIVSATTSNGLGVAGIAGGMRSNGMPGVKIMALRAGYLASDGQGYVNMTDCAEAIDYAVAHGASVFNASWGASGTLIRTAVLNAVAAGVVVCKASGNDNSSIPDIFDSTYGVLAVAALKANNVKADFSNFGTWVDIAAPGVDILATYGAGGIADYDSLQGTSMASPVVAGVAALLKSHHPWFTKTEIDTLLLNYADDVDADNPGFVGLLGAGRVNAFRPLSILTTADFAADVTFGKTPLTVNFTDVSPNAPSGPYSYAFGDAGTASTANATHTYTAPGIYSVTFTASGPTGPHTRTRPELIIAVEDTIEYEAIELEIGTKAPIPVRLRNTHPMKEILLPFQLAGAPAIFIDSLTVDARTAGWTATLVFDNRFSGQIAFRLDHPGGEALPAGNGLVANLWVRNMFGTAGQVETVDTTTLGGTDLQLTSNWVTFTPDFVSGSVTLVLGCECPFQIDLDASGNVDAVDLGTVIDIVFFSAADTQDPKCPATRADFNADGLVDAVDLAGVIDHVFFSGPPAGDPCAP